VTARTVGTQHGRPAVARDNHVPMRRVLGCLAVLVGLGAVACGVGEASLDGGAVGDGPPGATLRDSGIDPCDQLLLDVCGSISVLDAPCQGVPACTAADLTARYEPSTCQARLDDAVAYPDCPVTRAGGVLNAPPQSCEDLRSKVCGLPQDGGSTRCAETEDCAAADDVADTNDPSMCLQALGDDTSYPRCL
jgi:hypothetical protein